MILTCPECSTRFLVNEALLEPNGRKVKCAKCTHIWFQEPNRMDGDSIDIPRIEEIPQSVRPIPEGSGLPVPTEEGDFSFIRFAAVFALFFVISFGGLLSLKDAVVQAWEPSAKLFETVGMKVLTEGQGISIEDLRVSERQRGDKKIIQLTGFLRNTSDRERNVPLLLVSFEDGAGNKEEFTFETSIKKLSMGQSSRFQYERETELHDAKSAILRFVIHRKAE